MDLPLIHLLSDHDTRSEAVARCLAPSCRVRRFGRAADLLGHLDEQPAPDLLLVDVVARGPDGVVLGSRLRPSEPRPRIPLVFLTAADEPLSVVRALLACGDDFVAWPVGADTLLARVELHLAGRTRRDRAMPQDQMPGDGAPAEDAALQDARRNLEKLVGIGLAFAAERDRRALLQAILQAGRDLAHCEAATLFLRTEHDTLRFELRTQADPLPVSELPLVDPDTGAPNHRFVATHVALSAQAVVIDDVYRETRFDLSGTKRFSDESGMRAVSMVTVPMALHTGEVVGVLQFVNARDPQTGAVTTFGRDLVRILTAMAAHAAVAVENVELIESQKTLMDSLIRIIAGAIDAKSPYTGGHAQRVPELALMLAREASRVTEGPLAGFAFDSEDEWREFRIGAWLHDCGKVTSPEYVVDKATKLETIYNRIHEIRTRFEVLLRDARIEALEAVAAGRPADDARAAYEARRAALQDDFAFVAECNLGGEFMAAERVERLQRIAQQTWWRHFDDRLGLSAAEAKRHRGAPAPLPAREDLLADKPQHLVEREANDHLDERHGFKLQVPRHLYHHGELHNLAVARGTLTEEERFKINDHIVQTIVMLEQLPLPKNLRRVPEYAGTHHETLRGTGYPRRLAAADLSVPARIMAIADIFEALSASDRPYKKAKMLSECVEILWRFKTDGHIDPVLFDLFLQSGVYRTYADRFLRPEQIDEFDIRPFLGSLAPAD